VFDVSDPYRPVQLASVPVGGGDASRSVVLTGDGKFLVVPNALDSTVTVVDVASRTPVRTFDSITNARLAARSATRRVPRSRWVRPPQPRNEVLSFEEEFLMNRLIPTFMLAFALTVGPSAACDPEEMIKELRAQCREAIESASTLIDPVKSDLSSAELALIEVQLTEAGKLCGNDKYTDGFLAVAKVVRFAGHVEARKGVTPVF